ncbi:hypothetical protein BU15DRAFT_83906 [Melanogaster broomeanus]|nr:hypothetical protein BU15DRAFT_83906 [Melanogaster broomeanus]
MLAFSQEAVKKVTRYLLQLTLYDVMRSSHDFEDVKADLNERTNWTIEALRSFFTIRFADEGHFVTLCAFLWLVIAESMHLHYGRLAPHELKDRVENMGYATFAILIATLDLGIVVIRVAGIFTMSGSPGLAMCLILFSAVPSIVLPLLLHLTKIFWPRNRQPTAEQGEIGGELNFRAPQLEQGNDGMPR